MRGKYLRKDKFLSSLKSGLAFCDVVMGWDSNDAMYDNVQFTGWHTAYPDAAVRIDPKSCRCLPLETGANGEDMLRSEEHTSELQSLMRNSYAVFCLKNKTDINHRK